MESEPPNAQDVRVEKLWQSLHTGPIVPLDLEGLRAGLRKIKHPLANARGLLEEIFRNVDTSGNGMIEFEEFQYFVKHTEDQLWELFRSIDKDSNGQLDKDELHDAFKKAGIQIDGAKLEQFFLEVDSNHDGRISFDEWRDFLLFLPAHVPNLRAVLSYYSSTVFSNLEGDTNVSDEGAQGLGNTSLFSMFFGVFLDIANYRAWSPSSNRLSTTSQSPSSDTTTSVSSHPAKFPWDPGEEQEGPASASYIGDAAVEVEVEEESLLTSLLPDPGYFIAGGIAGAVSRTATAPLDRLKVYLIAQTNTAGKAATALKSGAPVSAARTAVRPLAAAISTLWGMGGVRSLFAGNGLNVLKVMPESAIKFGSYEGSKRILAQFQGHDDTRAIGPWAQFFAAGMGGVISQFAIYPLDTLKFRMQCETVKGGLHGNALIIHTAKRMWQGSGFRAYYRGLGMGLIGMFPYSAIDLTTYEYLKRLVISRNQRKLKCSEQDAAPGRMLTGGIGALSSSFGASIVYPVNLLRTRLQSQGTVIHPPTYDGWRDCLQKTVRAEGVRALYRGLTPNLLKVVPSMSISYVVYESSKKVLDLR